MTRSRQLINLQHIYSLHHQAAFFCSSCRQYGVSERPGNIPSYKKKKKLTKKPGECFESMLFVYSALLFMLGLNEGGRQSASLDLSCVLPTPCLCPLL